MSLLRSFFVKNYVLQPPSGDDRTSSLIVIPIKAPRSGVNLKKSEWTGEPFFNRMVCIAGKRGMITMTNKRPINQDLRNNALGLLPFFPPRAPLDGLDWGSTTPV
jgi:hypothetical protein